MSWVNSVVVRGMSSRLQVARDAKAEQTGLGLEIRNITDLFKKDTMIFFFYVRVCFSSTIGFTGSLFVWIIRSDKLIISPWKNSYCLRSKCAWELVFARHNHKRPWKYTFVPVTDKGEPRASCVYWQRLDTIIIMWSCGLHFLCSSYAASWHMVIRKYHFLYLIIFLTHFYVLQCTQSGYEM